MNKCSFCDNEAILHSGRHYCANHIHRIDSVTVSEMIPASNQQLLDKFLLWAFNTTQPNLTDLRKLYSKVDRGEWNEKTKRFDKPQDIYLLEAWIAWLKEELNSVDSVDEGGDAK